MTSQIMMTPNFLTLSLAVLLFSGHTVDSYGYSYSRFIGPVRGPEHQIIVRDRHDGTGRVDYVARPEYHFAYGVEDAKTRVLQNRRETRNGDAVKGVYSVVDPDGSLRVVKYTADNANGFQAEVISNGVSRIHGQDYPAAALQPPPVPAGAVGAVGDVGNVVDIKDNHQHVVEVQHPAQQEEDGGRRIPVREDAGNNESSEAKDAGDYQDEEDDRDDGAKPVKGNEAEEQDESDEELEDY